MYREIVIDTIKYQVDPDELVDILGLSTEDLLIHLEEQVLDAIDQGKFSYLEIDYEEEGENND